MIIVMNLLFLITLFLMKKIVDENKAISNVVLVK